jgi:SNF family Na+-dependent transporter
LNTNTGRKSRKSCAKAAKNTNQERHLCGSRFVRHQFLIFFFYLLLFCGFCVRYFAICLSELSQEKTPALTKEQQAYRESGEL